jgi:OPT family oligopeptide transporter
MVGSYARTGSMPLFQSPPRTPDEIARSRPLEIGPEEVLTMEEKEWYARVYRGDDVPQLTVRAVVMGSVLGVFLAFTNLYIGLKTGIYLGVAITAVILSFSIWTLLERTGFAKSGLSILENNCMQSCASCAGYGTGSTIITAVPALLLLTTTATDTRGHNLPWWIVALWTLVLAGLGVTLGIPMKRSMINREKLRFPEGTAAAVTLQSLFSHGREALLKARALYVSAAFGALVPLLTGLNLVRTGKGSREPLFRDSSAIFDWLPKLRANGASYSWSQWTMRLDHSFLLLGAGAIVGLRVSASLVLGGLILVFFVGPHAMESTWVNPMGDLSPAPPKPGAAWKQIGLWYGAPLMVSYGLTSFAMQGGVIARAVKGIFRRVGAEGEDDAKTREVEVPLSWFVAGGSLSALAIIALAWGYFGISPLLGLLAVLLSFFLALVATRATVETSVTSMGPMGKITQLTYGVLMPQNAVANLVTAGITASSASSCADLLNDLKVGYLLGANPRRQFIAQLFGVAVGTVATTLGYFVLIPDATAITGVDGQEPRFPAPGAQQWKAVADVFRIGISNLHPLARQGIAVGLALGAVLALAELALPRAKKWLPSATGIGFGLMLPFSTPLSFLLGALIAEGVTRANRLLGDRYVVPVASGVIAGESILGVFAAAVNTVLP